MITKSNLRTEYPKLAQSELPNALRQASYNVIVDVLELYDDDKDIDDIDDKETVDLFIANLNAVAKKPQKAQKSAPKKPAKPAKKPETRNSKPETRNSKPESPSRR